MEAKEHYKGKPFKWIVITGDVANMYDELDHHEISGATSRAMGEVAEWANKRYCNTKGVTVNRDEAKLGTNYNLEDGVYIPFSTLQEVSDFDNQNCVFQSGGKLYRRRLGCPMGGFLSPAKANPSLALREFVFSQLQSSLGIVGGGCRYMDDLILCFAVGDEQEEIKARWLISYICGPRGYPYPLQLDVEPEAQQYQFLETIAGADGETLFCKHFSKYRDAVAKGITAFSRLPSVLDGH